MSNLDDLNKAERQPPVKGVEIEMGGMVWKVSALTLRQMDALDEARKKATEKQDAKALFKANLNAIQGALARNYPGITTEDVLDLVDAENFQKVLAAVMGASGVAEGNAMAANPSTLTE